MDIVDYLEWAGCIFGSAGALVLALNTHLSRWGFVLFLIANIAWIAYGIQINAHGLVVNQLFFTATSLVGIKRWMVKSSNEKQNISKC